MRVLWITNSPFPEISTNSKLDSPVKGWVYSAAKALTEQLTDIKLGIVSFHKEKDLKQIENGRIVHFLVPIALKNNVYNPKHDKFWKQIRKLFNPDIEHIHGSEYYHSYSYVKACGSKNVVLSIQGLVSICERYYYGNIKDIDLIKSVTLRDIVKLDTIFSQHRNMRNRGVYEKLLLQSIEHVIGRTSWDKSHTWAINPKATYYFCNETLRPSFYNNNWSLENCIRHRIFISQGHYPIKGIHQFLHALPIILRHYPETKVYVAGNNFFTNRGIRLNGFGKYINSLIKKYNLSNHIIFTGILSEEKICQQFLNAHISICPSAIENSPNSIGESQVLGVPCIASYVGGNADLISHGKTGLLYRFQEVEMLASHVCELFSNDSLALKISEQAKISALKRHDKERNAMELYKIYLSITGIKKSND